MTWRKYKVSKTKKILPCEIKFLVPNYSCPQNHWLGGYHPQIPVLSVLCPQLNLLNPPPPKKIPGYATGQNSVISVLISLKSDTVSPYCVTNGNTILVTNQGVAVFTFLAHCRFHPLHTKVENRIMRCNQSCQNVPYTVQIQAHLALLKSNTCPVAQHNDMLLPTIYHYRKIIWQRKGIPFKN